MRFMHKSICMDYHYLIGQEYGGMQTEGIYFFK
jgi:hypothetical protein